MTIKYKALVAKERGQDGRYCYMHLTFHKQFVIFEYNGKPNLYPPDATLESIIKPYLDIIITSQLQKYNNWHELVDCELTIKDSTT